MDVDALSLMIILRQELSEIADNLQKDNDNCPTEDIITDNGINNIINQENVLDNDNNDDVNDDNNSQSPSIHDDDEKAQELQITPNNNSNNLNNNQMQQDNNNNNNNCVGIKLEELINNYLTPSIKQLSVSPKKKKKKKKSKQTNQQSPSPSKSLLSPSPPLSPVNNNKYNNYNKSPIIRQPGQVDRVMDDMANYSEKCGSCCRRFVTALFCGCGMFQLIGLIVIFFIFGVIFVFYNVSELTLILKEINNWKRLNIQQIEYELEHKNKLAQLHFDLDVDLDKLQQEHQHRESMEIINAKKHLTQEFIDKNTRTVTTTYWNFLTTETQTVTQTIFSEDDIAFFQNNILYYGFNADKAIANEPLTKQEIKEKITNEKNNNSELDGATCSDDYDSFEEL